MDGWTTAGSMRERVRYGCWGERTLLTTVAVAVVVVVTTTTTTHRSSRVMFVGQQGGRGWGGRRGAKHGRLCVMLSSRLVGK
jgi:hypothetical protein